MCWTIQLQRHGTLIWVGIVKVNFQLLIDDFWGGADKYVNISENKCEIFSVNVAG